MSNSVANACSKIPKISLKSPNDKYDTFKLPCSFITLIILFSNAFFTKNDIADPPPLSL